MKDKSNFILLRSGSDLVKVNLDVTEYEMNIKNQIAEGHPRSWSSQIFILLRSGSNLVKVNLDVTGA